MQTGLRGAVLGRLEVGQRLAGARGLLAVRACTARTHTCTVAHTVSHDTMDAVQYSTGRYVPLYPGAQEQLRWSAVTEQVAPLRHTPASQAASRAVQLGAAPGAPV